MHGYELLHARQRLRRIAVEQRLILLGLRHVNLSMATIAAAWHLDPATLADRNSVPLLDRSGRAREIEQQVLDEVPGVQTPPHRGVSAGARSYACGVRGTGRAG